MLIKDFEEKTAGLSVRCDRESFREVRFKSGFNIVLAERIKEATDKNSGNGAGKTTLIEIILFCLGVSTKKNKGLRVKLLPTKRMGHQSIYLCLKN
jgi:uncharacterized protein YydD (DUF2326 family)